MRQILICIAESVLDLHIKWCGSPLHPNHNPACKIAYGGLSVPLENGCPRCGNPAYEHRSTQTWGCSDPDCGATGTLETLGFARRYFEENP